MVACLCFAFELFQLVGLVGEYQTTKRQPLSDHDKKTETMLDANHIIIHNTYYQASSVRQECEEKILPIHIQLIRVRPTLQLIDLGKKIRFYKHGNKNPQLKFE